MRNLLIALFLLLPCTIFSWEEEFVERLKEEGYSKSEIEVILMAEKKRRRAEIEKSKESINSSRKEGDSEEKDDIEKDDIEKESKESKEDLKAKKDAWMKEHLEELANILKENEWSKSSISYRLAQHKTFLRKNYGKSEADFNRARTAFLKDLAKQYVYSALRGTSNLRKSCRDDVYEEYKSFINLSSKRRHKKINNIYMDLVEELKEKRQEVMSKAKSEVLKELREYWLEEDIPAKIRNERVKLVSCYFEALGNCTAKKEYREKAKKLMSKKKYSSKEKKIIDRVVKDYEPAD